MVAGVAGGGGTEAREQRGRLLLPLDEDHARGRVGEHPPEHVAGLGRQQEPVGPQRTRRRRGAERRPARRGPDARGARPGPAARPDGASIYVISDNLSAHKNWRILAWAKKNKVELFFTPTYASWANPIEAHFGPLRKFTIANSDHANHTVQTPALHVYLRWRNANARHPDVLAAQRRDRARIRSEKGIRWGGRPLSAVA
ncbi:hypothetical protein Mro03_18470 [Microbispora rosea subsp. rosea]|nr:hypothetical protein Mro03_18470 [Microbispora rosea subsp. rosea]